MLKNVPHTETKESQHKFKEREVSECRKASGATMAMFMENDRTKSNDNPHPLVKRYGLAELTKKQDPFTCYLQETRLTNKDT